MPDEGASGQPDIEIRRLQEMVESDPDQASQYLDQLLRSARRGNDATAEIVRDLAEARPDTVAPYFAQIITTAAESGDRSLRRSLIEACELIRDGVSRSTLVDCSNTVLDLYDSGSDVEKMLLSGIIVDLAGERPEVVADRKDIIDELMRAPATEAALNALRALDTVLHDYPELVTEFEGELRQIVLRSPSAEEATLALDVLCEAACSTPSKVDLDRVIDLTADMTVGIDTDGGAVIKNAVECATRLVIEHPDASGALIDAIVKNLNSDDIGVQRAAALACLSIAGNCPQALTNRSAVSTSYVADRIDQLNEDYSFDEQFDSYRSLIQRLRTTEANR